MKKDLLHTPEGVRDIYNTECEKKLVLQNRLHDVCIKYGYNDIQTPTLEFFDVFNKERGSVPSNEMFKLFDRYGNTLVMRPDMTPSIARTAAKYYSDRVLPIKLCYVGNTFINVSQYYQGKLKENTMIGAELIGDDSIYADFEIISMVIESMKSAGLTEFQVEIGNIAYFKGLLAQAGISKEDEETLVELIQEKNYLGVDELLTSLGTDRSIADVMLELPLLFGSVDVLDKAKRLATNETSLAAIDRLYRLYELCTLTGAEKYVSFDLGAVSKHSYYTGILFYAYTFGTGEPVIAGGRYDKLLGQFGCDKPSIGFSVTVDALMAAISRQNIDIPVDYSGVLLIYDEKDLADSVRIADVLRHRDTPVCMITYNSSKTDSQYCEYALNSQLSHVVKLPQLCDKSQEERMSAEATSINAHTQAVRTIAVSQLLGGEL
jgi:ATP phosphoribosyltransferase regulatory subunit